MLHEISTLRAPLSLAAPAPARQGLEPSLFTRGKRRVRALAEAVVPDSLVVWRGPRSVPDAHGAGRIALTFDDGPTSLTRDYLAALRRFDARATFFLVGELCARHPELVAAIASEGHEIAGHGYTHRRFPELSGRALREELERTRRLLPSDGRQRSFVRPPHGALSLGSTLTTASAGFTTVLWSYDSGDWATESPEVLVERFSTQKPTGGDIILCHEGQTWTLDALSTILGALRKAGHELVTTGELLGR